MYTAKEMEIVNRTARSAGAVGRNAIVPRIVRQVASKQETILDFGSGPKAIHTMALREEGFQCYAFDIGYNAPENYVIITGENIFPQYSIVFASNVLNVQPQERHIKKTVETIHGLTSRLAIVNYPKEPRKTTATPKDVQHILETYFPQINRIGSSSAPVWICFKQRPDAVELTDILSSIQ